MSLEISKGVKISRCARNDTITATNEAGNLRHALLAPTEPSCHFDIGITVHPIALQASRPPTPCHFDTNITCHFDTAITCHFDERSEEKSFRIPAPLLPTLSFRRTK